MADNRLHIGNSQLRQLWLAAHGLASVPSGTVDVMSIIRRLGFLQIDTVRNVVRAQDHILWSRNHRYREDMVWDALRRRELFEHFTHDASLIPMDVYPLWQRQFHRLGEKAARAEWYQSGLAQAETEAIHARIKAEGPLSTHAFDSARDSTEMWSRPPHKKALEQMWYAGVLGTAERRNFVKYYDLGARVFPPVPPDRPDAKAAGAMLCDLAMDRMGIANAGEIRRFWEAVPPDEVRDWIASRDLIAARVQAADGTWQDSWAVPDLTARLEGLLPPSTRMRIINPFDPAIRDRKRLQRIFGFEYTNEMFVPQAKRKWGYYVYPLLEGDRFVGRLEAKADRDAGLLRVTGFWPETGVRWGQGRAARLSAELDRFARLAGVQALPFAP
ncbi:MAG: winged helix DNA-binding domain-containing protein [Alphaproteobacteria bacterium]|nr:winged helix DNA-binding domain-containing protein [Alphaproteobacteria bacterium]